MSDDERNAVTIHIAIDEHYRLTTTKNNSMIRIDTSPIEILYPVLFDTTNLPSVPECYKQPTIIEENIDCQIETASSSMNRFSLQH
jgi:hypothetical protein